MTATSANHFQQLHGLIRTAQNFLPAAWRIVVYDLVGDMANHELHKLSDWCGVEYRRFDPRRLNASWNPKYLTLSVWKPLIIRDCLLEFPENQGLVLYADTSTRIHGPLSASLIAAALSSGIVARKTASPVAYYTHERMVVEIAKIMNNTRSSLKYYMDVPMVCGCLSLWANTPFILEQVIAPWVTCTQQRNCILPTGADGQDNRIGLSTKCVPGLEGHCHRGDQSALSVILHESFRARELGHAPYLRNTSVGAESWRMCEAHLHGTRFTTERSSWQSAPPMRRGHANCSRAVTRVTRRSGRMKRAEPTAPLEQPGDGGRLEHSTSMQQDVASCPKLTHVTRIAVPTGVQPIFPGMGGAGKSLQRFLRPCATSGACSVGAQGCFSNAPKATTIGLCNSTHGVEYQHRLPLDGEPAIVSFFNPSGNNVRDALVAIAKARPRLYIEFEPPVHARVPQIQVLQGVDGQITYARRAMVHYPYFTPTQLWQAAREPNERRSFADRIPAIAAFVSNCRGHRAEAIDWLRRRFEVHSYGACRHGVNASSMSSHRKQRIEGGHFPECLRYRAVLAIENNACEDYVSEKLIEAVRCGAVPIVRTLKGVPDYKSLFGSLPVLDASSLDDAFEAKLRAVLENRQRWEGYLPSFTPSLIPDAHDVAKLDPPNPHCQLISIAARYRQREEKHGAPTGGTPTPLAQPIGNASGKDGLTPIRCETWYKLYTPHGQQTLPKATV